ncbi:MAG: hypothetical protein H6839_15985 [Planctomycetes bacterium]|nr:hypothetical protein [Planctomycetota bacterium]
MAYKCENCGDALQQPAVARGMRYLVCKSCGTIHNLEWMRCRADGKAYVQTPVRLPEGTQIERDENGVHVFVENQQWEAREGLTLAVTVTIVLLVSGLIALISHSPLVALLCVGAAMTGGSYTILYSVAARRTRVEFHANAWGLTYRTLFGLTGDITRKFAWPEIRLIDPFVEKKEWVNPELEGNIPAQNWIGIRIRCGNGEEVTVAPWMNSVEQALFVVYHLQQHERVANEKSSPPVNTRLRRRGAFLRRTLLETPGAPGDVHKGELSCSRCGAPIATQSISARYEAAVCAFCGAVRDLRGVIPAYEGDQRLEFPIEYRYARNKQGLRVSRGEPEAERGMESTTYKGLFGSLIMLAAGVAMPSIILAQITKTTFPYLLIPLGLIVGVPLVVMYFQRYRTGIRAEALVVSRRGVALNELRSAWGTRARIPRDRIRNVFAQADATGISDSARVVFELEHGESVVSFEMPSPWHSQMIVREARQMLGLTHQAA